jgi:hypothetical protein
MVGMALGGQEAPALVQETEPSALDSTPLAPLSEVITLSDILDPPAAEAAQAQAPELPVTAPVPAVPAPDPLVGLLGDPVLMDRLAKALVARLGDQVLREIAWEVMPELAERMHPQETP